MTTYEKVKNRHINAIALIVAAAEKSGLLKEVAEVLCFDDQNPNPAGDCRACELYERLAEAFDDHTGLAAGVLESFHGEGFTISPYTDAELAPYLGRNRNA
jgi:hypothetical protein